MLCLLLLSVGTRAQEVVGPDGPDGPSTGEKTITVTQVTGGTISPTGDTDGKVTVKGGPDRAYRGKYFLYVYIYKYNGKSYIDSRFHSGPFRPDGFGRKRGKHRSDFCAGSQRREPGVYHYTGCGV